MGHKIKPETIQDKEHSVLQQTETQNNPLKEKAITVIGPHLYNSLPKYLRDIESVKTYFFHLSSTYF